MIKTGDMFKNIESGEILKVKSVDPSLIILANKEGSHSVFVKPGSMESAFMPFAEDEGKRSPEK